MTRDAFMTKLLKTYLKEGMRVLDIGCGTGDVTFLARELVGDSGFVCGIDSNVSALEVANQRQQGQAYDNLDFRLMDLTALDGPVFEQSFDAIIGRRVLMYLKSPQDVVRQLKPLLTDSGYLIFEESDALALQLNDTMPCHQRYQQLIWDTVKAEGGHVNMGRDLLGLLTEADMAILDYRSENRLEYEGQASELLFILKVMRERFISHQLIKAENFDLAEIEQALQSEKQDKKVPFVRDVTFGIVGQHKKI